MPENPPSQASLLLVVFLGGVSTMSVEMLASRLIAPFFGTSLLVWSLLLFSILAALSVGYLRGGRRADRDPRPQPLARSLLIASVLLSIGPFLCRDWMLVSGSAGSIPLQGTGLFLTVLFICFPVALLGGIGPFVIRLMAQDPLHLGQGSGKILGLSTMGSILGTYLPALVGIPFLGTLRSFLALAFLVGLASAIATPPGGRRPALFLGMALPLVLFLVLKPGLFHLTPITTASEPLLQSTLGVDLAFLKRTQQNVFEGESVYNTIQVRRVPTQDSNHPLYYRNMLVLNEGYAVHSIQVPKEAWCFPLVGSVWDYMGVLPALSAPPGQELDVAIVGLAGGTVAREILELFRGIYPKINVSGAEIDPVIVDVARKYFDLPPEVKAFAEDGRTFLRKAKGQYDLIVTDAYRQPYIPFHLTTLEYFTLVRSRLKPHGMCSINVGATSPEADIVAKIRSTMQSVFDEVKILEVPRATPLFTNFLILGGCAPGVIKSPLDPRNAVAKKLRESFPRLPINDVFTVWHRGLTAAPKLDRSLVLTDDRAPVEFITDAMILRTIPKLNISEIQR
ncbi:MAG: fused MFS/spermidine synthase [Candidatus Riflebacteria bacterium]|nr:fused MFS/spermidine synthase [Candidatus Riflebacteria bacterium]